MNKVTFDDFWKTYDFLAQEGPLGKRFARSEDRTRSQWIAGYAALEATFQDYWQKCVRPEWDETRTLLMAVLENPTVIREFSRVVGLSRPQDFAERLQMLAEIEDCSGYAPNVGDAATLFLLLNPLKMVNEDFAEWTRCLFEIQSAREMRLLDGPNFDAVTGQRLLRSIQKVRGESLRFHPYFTNELSPFHEERRAA
ncbi:MAG: hypothetical protein JST16_02380 [Bdellovibrionales bacterium]|nr:hypothetical protein [Bdellovibrionales bacterium]